MKSISQILKDSKTVAVVGLSNKPDRDSYKVAEYMKEHGYRILPVNPSYAGQQILGEVVHASAQDAAHALATSGQRIENRAAADLARAAGLDVVMDQCVKMAHKMMSA